MDRVTARAWARPTPLVAQRASSGSAHGPQDGFLSGADIFDRARSWGRGGAPSFLTRRWRATGAVTARGHRAGEALGC